MPKKTRKKTPEYREKIAKKLGVVAEGNLAKKSIDEEKMLNKFLIERWDEFLSFIGSKRGTGERPRDIIKRNPQVLSDFVEKKMAETGIKEDLKHGKKLLKAVDTAKDKIAEHQIWPDLPGCLVLQRRLMLSLCLSRKTYPQKCQEIQFRDIWTR